MESVGNPHFKLKAIHVAGTKGKGSTCIMIDNILRSHGMKTGLYTSPHLVDLMERIQINGRNCDREVFVRAVNRLAPSLRKIRPTFFELMTAASFIIFEEARVDFAIIEVGLGGRLDSTNILSPVMTVITPIGYDHQHILGHRLEDIAREKAGIIKPSTSVVVAPQRESPRKVIVKVCLEKRAPIIWPKPLNGMNLPLHQRANAAVAVAVSKILLDRFSKKIAFQALNGITLPGRWEIISPKPLIIIDSAHNETSIRSEVPLLKGKKWLIIFGSSKDKPIKKMLKILTPYAGAFVFTKATSARAEEPDVIYSLLRPSLPVFISDSVSKAMAIARRISKPYHGILVTGSFYVAGEAIRWLRESRDLKR